MTLHYVINKGDGHVVHAGVRKYEADFGTRGACYFTTEDILLAAAELDEYYAQHVRECENAAAA